MNLWKVSAGSSSPWAYSPALGLFLASFLALFLELLVIRWVPLMIRIVAYYSNLMLMSSFLGLGCGLLLERKGLGLYRWFPPLLLLLVSLVFLFEGAELHTPDELRFSFWGDTRILSVPINLIFIANALVFVPLGELIGCYIRRMPPLRAYSWDLGGAIAGTLVFGIWSYFWFSPILGSILAMGIYLIFCGRKSLLISACIFFLVSLAVMSSKDIKGIWSPYNHIAIIETEADGYSRQVYDSPASIRVMKDPPFYMILVNRVTYMWAGTINSLRYTDPSRYQLDLLGLRKTSLLSLAELYALPHLIRPGARDVLVVGSGAGIDVEAALLYGAGRVDAVEIDPVIIRMGYRYSASQSYKDPRVTVHNTDARAFIRQATRKYDMVVFGFLDSHGLFSQMSNIRLDGYVYTRESLREAFGLLREGGLLALSFFPPGQLWLLDRLAAMLHSATGQVPLVYARTTGEVIILVGKGFAVDGPIRFIEYRRVTWKPLGTPEATDDWPFLYLRRRFIPRDYLINIGALLAASLAFILLSSRGGRRGVDLHFFFLGAGFLLLETKSITTISLYFGTTWLVSMVVILGVLLMVLAANLVASRLRRFSLLFYVPLIASVIFLYLFPTQSALAWPFSARLLYSLTVIPLPIFFGGLVFSTTFRDSRDPVFAFGSNLLGAMVGGFTEYLGMVTGLRALLLIVSLFYLASIWVRLRSAGMMPSVAQ